MIFHRLGFILNREARRGAVPSKTPPPLRLRKERGTQGVRLLHKNQRGFTLIEMIVAMTITVLIIGVIAMAIFQVFNVNALSSNHMTAVRQVQNAGYWISRDAQMAQSVVPDDGGATGFPLTLTRTEWEGDEHQVVYTIIGDRLQREHYINSVPDSTIFVAEYVVSDPEKTNCVFTNGKLTLTVTATVGTWPQEEIETRVYEIVPRPA